MNKKITDKIKNAVNLPKEKEVFYLPTGSTLINLACTSDPHKGFSTGHYYLFVGASSSGKTWLSLTLLAEAVLSKQFKDYRLIFNCPEDGALMDLRQYFGGLEDRIEILASESLEGFYFDFDDKVKDGKPFIYVLDSMDAIKPIDDAEHFQKAKAAYKKGEEGPGSYGTGKAKVNAGNLNKVISDLKRTNSILVVISQSKDKIQSFGMGGKTRSGGHSLKFYATCELWFDVTESITKTVKNKTEKLGSWLKMTIKKNRQTGVDTSVDIPFLVGHGIDDTWACIEFLCDRGFWKSKSAGFVNAPQFDFEGKKEDLIKKIESESLFAMLQQLTHSLWIEIRDACKPQRVNKYRTKD